MPEDTTVGPDLERVLDHLDDFALNEQNYKTIQDALEKSNGIIKVKTLDQLLTICIHDLKEDMKNTLNALNIIMVLLKKIKAGAILNMPNLVPSALAVLHVLKTTAIFGKVEELKIMCFEIILSYPDDILITLVVSHYIELIELFNLYCHQRVVLEIKLKTLNIIFKILKILPPDKRTIFVREGAVIWFSKVIPTVMTFASMSNTKNTMPIETLEMLTEEVVAVDYANYPTWREVMECINTPNKYPAIMRNLLEEGNDMWYRLWIIFTKLLKSQITKSTNTFGSPINSLLPVVEAAFKMNVKNRCRAFQCWNVLIDSFSSETNEAYLNKRFNLLIIPLTSNNAKVEETALAKLNTWWHLIIKFEAKVKNWSDAVLLQFLNFCFGRCDLSDKPMFAPGLLTINTKRQVLQAFANITGHINCDCTVSMEKLNTKVINSKLLVDHWKMWSHALTITIRICVKDSIDSVNQHFKCVWRSFIASIAEVADCNVRYNLFVELLKILEVLLQSPRCDKLADIIFNIVTNSILDHENRIQPVFKPEYEETSAIHRIVSLILDPKILNVFTRYDAKEIVNKIKPLTKFIVAEYLNEVTENFLKQPLVQNNSLMLWTSLSESLCELQCETTVDIVHNMLLLPLKSISLFTSVEISTAAWFMVYEHAKNELPESPVIEDIYKLISDQRETITSAANKQFVFRASLVLLNDRIMDIKDSLVWKIAETLQCVTNEINYLLQEDDLSLFLNTITSLLNKITNKNDEKLARTMILTINNILKMTTNYYKRNEIDDHLFEFLIKILEPLKELFHKEAYSSLKSILVDELRKCMQCLKCSTDMEKRFHSILNNLLCQKNNKSEENNIVANSLNPNHNKFTEPNFKVIPKKGKKKDSNIIDTVVENGEEFVVVKSNWKFNPKKLTDNQKEKFQRTREDIPALYQDLSQSQDEFKRVFGTNSADSTTGSKSNTTENENASSILKNISCSNVVPGIIKNILIKSADENRPEGLPNSAETKSNVEPRVDKINMSPRVALKDRVFRNVRNLIEKSSLQKDEELNSSISENLPSTPQTKQHNNVDLVNSAPPDINPVRPSRVTKKPKKFDDHKLSPLKRRRDLLKQKDSQNIHSKNNETKKKETEGRSNDISILDQIIDNSIEKNLDNIVKNTDNNILKEPTNNAELSEIIESCPYSKELREEASKTVSSDEKHKNANPVVSGAIGDSLYARENSSDTDSCNVSNDNKNLLTPTNNDDVTSNRSQRKRGKRKSRLENELAIDTVEGNPFLKNPLDKRLTRNSAEGISPVIKRKRFSEKKPQNCKTESKPVKNSKDNEKSIPFDPVSSQSQDIIESSQDSTVPHLTTKATNKLKRVPIVALEIIKQIPKENTPQQTSIQHINTPSNADVINEKELVQNDDDLEISRNKTVFDDNVDLEITAEMDTEIAEKNTSSGEIIEINDDIEGNELAIVNTNDDALVELDINGTDNADTQVEGLDHLEEEIDLYNTKIQNVHDQSVTVSAKSCNENDTPDLTTQCLDTQSITEPSLISEVQHDNTEYSPFKDEEQRKQDFLNNTIEISPIKTLSPVREEQKSPTLETSSDFVVVTLACPVQSNGEPFNKIESPEMSSNEKVSPDKRDQSPPRDEIIMNYTSPSSSLSLKKNRPQLRPGGRAAQMLVLCAPDNLPNKINPVKATEPEENKRSMATNSSARRNLRKLYNSTGDNNEMCDDNEEGESFLKLKRYVPTADSSPSCPILKRKLTDIIDDATVSPVSKRKRVSFHDPPVSTTVCVKNYISLCGLRSPQSSTSKRSARQVRSHANMKSPKRLDNVFNSLDNLDSALTKVVESFTENDKIMTNENYNEQDDSIEEETQTSELNNTDPICPTLLDCNDPIKNIMTELASPTKKLSLIRDFEGKVETFGDMAKLTELEVNKLCIKSPKVNVVKKVLDEYANRLEIMNGPSETIDLEHDHEIVDKEDELNKSNSMTISTQTLFTEEMTMSNLMTLSPSQRPDFISQLCERLDEPSKMEIANKLSLDSSINVLLRKVDMSNSYDTISALLRHHCRQSSDENVNQLSIIQDFLLNRFDSKNLIKFCSDVLRRVSDKPL